jgi:hypothetical protein
MAYRRLRVTAAGHLSLPEPRIHRRYFSIASSMRVVLLEAPSIR